MVTYHLLEYLRQQGFGTALDTDLFFEKLPLGKYGLAIYSVGGTRESGRRTMSQTFDLEARHATDDRAAMDLLEKIAEHFSDDFVISSLPTIDGVSNRQYNNCRILNLGNILNLGPDPDGHVIFKLTGQITYSK